MNKKKFKFIDVIVWIAFCIYLTVRVFYPKHYPSLSRYFPVFFILIIAMIIVLKTNDIYYDWKNNSFDLYVQVIKFVFIIIPLIIALVRNFS